MEITFIIGTHLNETPAHVIAKKIAKKLQKEMEVKIKKFPRKWSINELLENYVEEKISTKEFLKRFIENYVKKEIFLQEKSKNSHLIDFHNCVITRGSVKEIFKAIEGEKLPEIKLVWKKWNLLPFKKHSLFFIELNENYSQNGKIVGSIEIPAFFRRPSLGEKTKIEKKLKEFFEWSLKFLKKEDHEIIKFIASEILYIEFTGKKVKVDYCHRFEKAYLADNKILMTDKIINHLANEIKRIIKEEEEYVEKFPSEKFKRHRLTDFNFLIAETKKEYENLIPENKKKVIQFLKDYYFRNTGKVLKIQELDPFSELEQAYLITNSKIKILSEKEKLEKIKKIDLLERCIDLIYFWKIPEFK